MIEKESDRYLFYNWNRDELEYMARLLGYSRNVQKAETFKLKRFLLKQLQRCGIRSNKNERT